MTGAMFAGAAAAAAVLVVHVLCLALAPLAVGLNRAGDALMSGQAPASPLLPVVAIAGGWRRPAGGVAEADGLVCGSAAAACATTGLAALLVPSFAAALPFGASDGLVLVGFLLVLSRLARLAASLASGAPATAARAAGRALPSVVLLVPAMVSAALLASWLGGATGLVAALDAAAAAPAAPRTLLAASLGLLVLADRCAAHDERPLGRGRVAAVFAAEDALRFMTLLDLLCGVTPPLVSGRIESGLLPLAAALPLFLMKAAILAVAAGAARAAAARVRVPVLLAASSLFGVLGAVLLAVGQTLE